MKDRRFPCVQYFPPHNGREKARKLLVSLGLQEEEADHHLSCGGVVIGTIITSSGVCTLFHDRVQGSLHFGVGGDVAAVNAALAGSGEGRVFKPNRALGCPCREQCHDS